MKSKYVYFIDFENVNYKFLSGINLVGDSIFVIVYSLTGEKTRINAKELAYLTSIAEKIQHIKLPDKYIGIKDAADHLIEAELHNWLTYYPQYHYRIISNDKAFDVASESYISSGYDVERIPVRTNNLHDDELIPVEQNIKKEKNATKQEKIENTNLKNNTANQPVKEKIFSIQDFKASSNKEKKELRKKQADYIMKRFILNKNEACALRELYLANDEELVQVISKSRCKVLKSQKDKRKQIAQDFLVTIKKEKIK